MIDKQGVLSPSYNDICKILSLEYSEIKLMVEKQRRHKERNLSENIQSLEVVENRESLVSERILADRAIEIETVIYYLFPMISLWLNNESMYISLLLDTWNEPTHYWHYYILKKNSYISDLTEQSVLSKYVK